MPGSADEIAPPRRSALPAARPPHLVDLRELDTGPCGPLERADDTAAPR